MMSSGAAKDKFYENLHALLATVPNVDKLITREMATWMQPRSRRCQLLDYVLVRRRDRQPVLVTKAIRDADCWTYYGLATALEVLGRARHQNQDWFDDNDADISNLLAKKNGLHKAYMDFRTDATKAAFFRCQHFVRQWLREMQNAWMIQKAEEIQAIYDADIDRLPQVDKNNDMDLPPSLPETILAVKQISSGKAPGFDEIPPGTR
ncbi:unnamed protein product [Schistocephalus solidus]|uniref:DUF1957 domain-containing protein n=1 Tax=Schistocephalus solidus TaxID=70667 RepID=A0A183SPD7_SCHSO|nr:unnamed protein product [Schistocephalus solidus]